MLGAEDFILKPYHPEVLKKADQQCAEPKSAGSGCTDQSVSLPDFYNQTKRMLLHNPDTQFAMLYFNIKGFTVINDFYGNEKEM